MQQQIFNSDHRPTGNFASRFGAILAMAGLLLLSACSGGGKDVTQHNLAEPSFKDGVAPTLTSVSVRESTKSAKPNGFVKQGKSARIDIEASEALMKPAVTINGVEAEVTGQVNGWNAVRQMTDADTLGEVYFSIVYQDISGELGESVNSTTDGSALIYCDDETVDCPEDVNLAGDWRLDVENASGVGPASGDVQWWNTGFAGVLEERACLFDDIFRIGPDGSFSNIPGDETWIEEWQGGPPDGACSAPQPPHDGSTAGTWEYDEIAGTLTISGLGSHLGLPKAVNGGELPNVATPDTIVYDVLTLDGDSMTVAVEAGAGVWWTFHLVREPVSPLAGKWKLSTQGGAGVGPAPGDLQWWNTDIEGVVEERACLFNDIYEFGADGSFQNIQGTETWIEEWQGGPASGICDSPVAPHDGRNGAIYQYDEDAATLKLTGLGAFLGLPKAVNGGELPNVAVPGSIVYQVLTLDGDTMTVAVEAGDGVWWTFSLTRISNSPVVGKWKLASEGGAGVGPAPGDLQWWNTDIEGVVEERACLFDDIFHFGADGSFQNYPGTETWIEEWQGGPASGICDAPVAPHDGSARAVFEYDEAANTLTIHGKGAHLGLAKAANGGELPNVAVPDSITYDVLSLEGDTMTVAVEAGDGVWWTFKIERTADTVALAGKWRLNTSGGAGVGPAAGDLQWWNTDIDGVVEERDCLFDDVFDFGGDGSFMNDQGAETWIEEWQGGPAAGACDAPVAPHDGSARAVFEYDEAANTLTIHGTGAHLGLAKAVNGGELPNVAVPDSITYDVLVLDGDNLAVAVEAGDGVWWTFNLVRVSNSPLAGNWKLNVSGGAGVGPAPGDLQWWNTDIEGVVEERACLFDDVFHFGAGGAFQNFQDGETWIEEWQGGPAAGECSAPVAPHNGGSTGSFDYDDDGGTLTLRGRGSHVGLAKAVNGGELPNVAIPDSITYDVLSFDVGAMTVTVEAGDGVFWTFSLVKE